MRITRLTVTLAVAVIIVSVVFVNWYAPVAALGVGSIIIGLAVQTPMKSFIAWIYILVRQPFRVGDRIKIADATGDVIDVGYLDTTLWEFGGQYLSSDHPSGRLIKFPNEKVLDELVYNYSWPLFPYIWNEVKHVRLGCSFFNRRDCGSDFWICRYRRGVGRHREDFVLHIPRAVRSLFDLRVAGQRSVLSYNEAS